MVWHTQRYRYSGFPEINRAYPLYPTAAAAIDAIQKDRPLELERAKQLPAWLTFLTAQGLADQNLPAYARDVMVYRGQRDVSWPLMPTLYRKTAPGGDIKSELLRRRGERARVIAALFDNPLIETALPGAAGLSDLQREAVARHYGAPSSLVDMTCEPEVAAVFATGADASTQVGCIYAINLVELLSLAGLSTSSGIKGGYQVMLLPLGVTVIHYEAPDPPHPPKMATATIRFAPGTWARVRMTFTLLGVPNVSRINAQKGVFLAMLEKADAPAARDMWHLVDLVSQKYFFRHTQSAYMPQNPAFAEEYLLPTDDPIARMAGP